MTTPETGDRWSTALGCAIAAFALGQAMQAGNGTLQPGAIPWLTVALLATLFGVAAPAPRSLERAGRRAVVAVLMLGVAYQFYQLITPVPALYADPVRAGGLRVLHAGLALAAVLTGVSVLSPQRSARWAFPLVLVMFAFVGRWILVASPDPVIDTFVFQREAGTALAEGRNPYALRFADIYGTSPYYGPGLSVDGVLQFGYPYVPLSLLLTLPAQLLFGDYRYAQLTARLLSGALIAWARPGRIGVLAAALLLFTPRTLFVLEQGWTDPLMVVGFSAATYCAVRRKPQLPWVFGFALAMKQYSILMLPAALHLLPRPLRRNASFFLKALGVALLITMPFVLWSPVDFWNSVVMLQIRQPFRADSLSYLAWAAQDGRVWPTSLGFLAAAIALGLGLWRQPHTPAGFAATSALTYLAFFAFNKQAFANYYYFTLGVLAVAVVAVSPGRRGGDAGQEHSQRISAAAG